jgi:NADH:ubiquinone oxidoreductase subunit E
VACRTSNWTGSWSGSVSWCWRGWWDATWTALHTLHVPLVELYHVIVAYRWQLQAQGKDSNWTVCCAHRCALMWAMRRYTMMDGSLNWTLCSVRKDLTHNYW